MSLDLHEIQSWIKNNFNSMNRQDRDFKLKELMDTLGKNQELVALYELGKVDAESAFLLWLSICQKTSAKAFNSFFPLNYTSSSGKTSDYAPAFRDMKWIVTNDVRSLDANIYIPLLSAMVAGIKFQAYSKARTFADTRIQGGKYIGDWSLIKSTLNELHLEIYRDSKLINVLDPGLGLTILQNMDQFVSKCMQVFGGAGYIEDYEVENLFRICHFLKSWPRPFKELIMSFDLSKGSVA